MFNTVKTYFPSRAHRGGGGGIMLSTVGKGAYFLAIG